MYDKFGKKLEGARTRRGISIQQASNDLKIRGDFLLSFENDYGNFDLPDVYKRGFIKLYARYLKLDPEEIVADFNNYHNESHSIKRRSKVEESQRELLGTMSIEPEIALPKVSNDLQKQQSFEEEEDGFRDSAGLAVRRSRERALYIKIGALFGGALAVFVIIAIVINSMVSSSKPQGVESLDPSNNISLATNSNANLDPITISSDDNVHVVVRQENDKQRLFAGNVEKDHPITLSRTGPVKVHFSDGSKLTIQKSDGKKSRPGREGVGWVEL